MKMALAAASLFFVHCSAFSQDALSLFQLPIEPPSVFSTSAHTEPMADTAKHSIKGNLLSIDASQLSSSVEGDTLLLNLPNYSQNATIEKKVTGQFGSETLVLRSTWKGVSLLSTITITDKSVFMTLSLPGGQYSASGNWNSVSLIKNEPLALANANSPIALTTDVVQRDPTREGLSKHHILSPSSNIQTPAKIAPEAITNNIESDIPIFDLLMLYTSNSLEDMNNDPQGFIDHRTTYTNEVFNASDINVRVNILATMEVDVSYDNMKVLIDDLIYQVPPFTNIAQERDKLGADAVSVIFAPTTPLTFASGGISTLYPHFIPFDVKRGHYSVTGTHSPADVFAHEIGHNLGLSHSRDAGEVGADFDFGVGYRVPLPSSDGFNTIMAYDTNETTLIPLFSSPDLQCGDIPCGVEHTKDNFGSDAVEAVNRIAGIATSTGNTNNPQFSASEALGLIEDIALKQCLQSKINASANLLYASEIKELTCHIPSIISLNGLRHFSGLRELTLHQTNISDLSELSSLVSLLKVDIINDANSEISPLKGITDLKKLNGLSVLGLQNFNLTDEDAQNIVDALPQLYALSLWNTHLTKAPVFSNHPSLKNLALGDNEIEDISGILNLSSLQELILSGNAPLRLPNEELDFPNLLTLRLDETNITSLDALSKLTSLTELRAFFSQISDMSGISELTSLRRIKLYGSKLSSLNVDKLTQLEVLDVGRNDLANPSIPPLPNLQRLDLTGSQLNSLEFVKGLPNLMTLRLGDIGSSPLGVLTSLPLLHTLVIENSENVSSENWPSLPTLEELWLNNIQQDNIDFVKTMPRLTTLSISTSPEIKDISSLFRLPFLKNIHFFYRSSYFDNKPYCWQIDYLKHDPNRAWRNFFIDDYLCNEETENEDFDGDKIPNRKEIEDGTDPTDNAGLAGNTVELVGEFAPVVEGDTAQIGLVREGSISGSLDLLIRTEDGSAISYTDYIPVEETVTFQPGERFKILEIPTSLFGAYESEDKDFKVRIEGKGGFEYHATANITITKMLQSKIFIIYQELPVIFFDEDYRYLVSDDNYIVKLHRENNTYEALTVKLEWDELTPGALRYINNPPAFIEFEPGETEKEFYLNVTGIEGRAEHHNSLQYIALRIVGAENQYRAHPDSASLTLVLGSQNNITRSSNHNISGFKNADLVFYRHGSTRSLVTSPILGNGIERHLINSTDNSVVPFMAFLDGNDTPDILLYSQESHIWTLATLSGVMKEQTYFGNQDGDIPVPADYDGDGLTDIAIARPSTGHWLIKFTGTGEVLRKATRFSSGFIPTVADFDGDGIDDIGYRNPATGVWYLYKSDGYSHASDKGGDYTEIYFGSKEEDIPVHGDFDGDGIDDIAVRRPSIGSFFIKHSSTGKIYRTFFGSQPTDIPVVEDYDGDGITDIAVRRDSASGIYVLSTRYNQILRKGFGSYATDVFTASPIMSKMEKAAIIQQYGTGTEQRIDSSSTALPLDIEHFATEEVENGNF
ncbi:VCBS repeat-containing protein [Alteromonas sp. IB21]|uniref:reprolysin-like metallopeptidase n=1 Tax=Alteromonas sp. IB21 TaxID=2779369 RepID=UPI0018E8C8A3|nr:FG-GAP-like repeat-containing protein [Alteromonas sp. IB21]MBJ2130626.1 VCBS repeat-containing protein [Alteromonas sp. IB21]